MSVDNSAGMESVGQIIGRLANESRLRSGGGEGGFMTCSRCQTVNADGARFCSGCGAMLTLPGTYQGAARGAIVSQNLGLIMLVGLVLGFIGGALVGAYVFLPMGGWGAILGIACPIIGMVVGQRILLQIMAR